MLISYFKNLQHLAVHFSTLCRTQRLLGILFLASITAGGRTSPAQVTATVDLNTKYQAFEGWGTSLAWWANVAGGFPDTARNDYINRLFDPVTGLGLNIVRYNIGGGENPAYLPPNTTYLQYRARVPGFEPTQGTYDWTQDANQRWILQQAVLKNVNIAEAFSNSPPWWMTRSGSVTGVNGGNNNLNDDFDSNFVDYLTTVTQHYHDTWGITFRTLEAFNEPNSGYWRFGNNQEGCGFNTYTQNFLIKDIASSLAAKNMGYTSVSASDENSIQTADETLAGLDATAASDFVQLNTHSYNGLSERAQLQTDAANAHKRLWMSEYGDGDGSGLSTAAQIINDLKVLKPAAWIYWQAVDNAPGWGFVLNSLSDSITSSYTVNEKYYVFSNFSKLLLPGYQFVGMSDANSVAAYDGKGTVALVTLNSSNAAETVNYSLQNFGGGSWTVTPYQTSASQNLAQLSPLTVTGTSFSASLPAASVTTFVLTNGQSSPLVSGKTYQITNVNSGLLLEDPGFSTSTTIQMDQWGNNGGNNQKWLATAAGNNWVFTNIASGLAMDISAGNVNQAAVTHNRDQQWVLSALGNGQYTIGNLTTGNLVDVSGAATGNGAGILQYPNNGGSNQHWTFQAVN